MARSEREFPFDSELRSENQNGLDKLRCVADRGLARTLFELYFRLAPDTIHAEEFDPSQFGDEEPELDDLRDPAGAAAAQLDRECAALHHAWDVFYRNMADYEALHGRRLSRAQRADHVYKFGTKLEEIYGRTHPTTTWSARRKDWEERAVPKFARAAQ
jgi:hypothetical protein